MRKNRFILMTLMAIIVSGLTVVVTPNVVLARPTPQCIDGSTPHEQPLNDGYYHWICEDGTDAGRSRVIPESAPHIMPEPDPDPGPQNGQPRSCSTQHFLGLRAWYDGLLNTATCQMKQPSDLGKDEAGLRIYVWTIVLNLATMALQIIGYLAVGFVVWGGYQYILAKGEPGKVAAGRKTITNAITGLVICMSASILAGAISDIVSGAAATGSGNFFVNIINKALVWAGIVATIFIIYGGIQYVTSSGDPSKVTKAKNTIMYAAIGLVIAVLAGVIINTVLGALEGNVQ